ncbi:thiol reductant ABC exporter subunit CydC [Paenibacillus luteus]|uniref:thiol reductant ABC exporter subunit CydC n=1 Tax=Paenibacillus luteus TaxID=2545753 RepID=UPI00114384DA|nr:thiol reductant ABC exporter subunit CydC [Paenibacillus luteus]
MNERSILTQTLFQEKKDIAWAIIGGFVAGIGGVSLFAASGYMISQTVFSPPLYTLIILTSLVKILGLIRAASRYSERMYSHRATFSLLSRIRSTFFVKLVPLSPGLFNKKRSGDLLARFVGDVESLQHYFLRVAYPPIVLIMVFLATVLFVSFYSIWMALIFIVGMLITTFLIPSLILLGQRRNRGRVRLQRAQLSTEAAELLYGFRDLKVYGQLKTKEMELKQASTKLVDDQYMAARHLLRGQTLHVLLSFLVVWSVLLLGSFLINNGSLAGVFLAMLVMAALTVFDEAGAMAVLPVYKQDSEHAAQRLEETLHSGNRIPTVQKHRKLDDNLPVAIDISGVSFHYGDDTRPVLGDINLHIPAGSKTAIVGSSGSGKTTLFELLLGLYVPMSGQIRLNHLSTEELDEGSIWRAANVVLQHNHFFRGTVRDNLLIDASGYTDEQLTSVLESAELLNKSLDDLLDERGENWSDGERQRLALARSMLRGGRVWLLDEPTSSLDSVTEHRIMQRLLASASRDTVIIISHRLAGLEDWDQIVVLDQGKLVEVGSFVELMERKGYLYEMRKIEQQMIHVDR